MTKSRFFLYFCLAFVAGVFVASLLKIPALLLMLFAVLASVLIAFGISRSPSLKFDGQPLRLAVCGFLLISFIFGVLRFIQKADFSSRDLEHLLGTSVTITGRIQDAPSEKEKSQEILLEESATKNTVLIRVRKYPKYLYGQEITVEGKLEEPENFTEDFDYRAYLEKDGIFYVMNYPSLRVAGEPKKDLRYYLYSIKSAFSEKINAVLPEPHASFLSGLLLGERRSIPKELVEDFKKTGTTHIVALSGYNITIVAGVVMGFFTLLSLPFTVSFWLATFAISLFALLTGASASIVRASVMGVLVLLARKEGRVYSIRNALVFAGAVMVFYNPKILCFDVAFQLSFLATLGLIYVSPVIDDYFGKIKTRISWKIKPRFPDDENERFSLRKDSSGAKSFFREILVSTLSAQAMVLPLLIYNFGSLSLISPFANIAVLFAVPAAMLFGFLAGMTGFLFGPLSQVFSWVSWFLLEYEIRAITFFAGIPFASVAVSKIPFIFVAVSYIGIAYWLWRRGTKT